MKMYVRVDGAGRHDATLAGNHLGAGPDHHRGADAVHHVRIAGLADADDVAAAYSDIGLDDSPMIQDHGIRNHKVERAGFCGCGGRLPHPVAQDLSATELCFFTGGGEIAFDLD